MLYRILTEDKPNVQSLASRYFDAFTLIHATGIWRGTQEASAIIEIDATNADTWSKVQTLVTDLREYNHQEAVLVQRIDIDSVLL